MKIELAPLDLGESPIFFSSFPLDLKKKRKSELHCIEVKASDQ